MYYYNLFINDGSLEAYSEPLTGHILLLLAPPNRSKNLLKKFLVFSSDELDDSKVESPNGFRSLLLGFEIIPSSNRPRPESSSNG